MTVTRGRGTDHQHTVSVCSRDAIQLRSLSQAENKRAEIVAHWLSRLCLGWATSTRGTFVAVRRSGATRVYRLLSRGRELHRECLVCSLISQHPTLVCEFSHRPTLMLGSVQHLHNDIGLAHGQRIEVFPHGRRELILRDASFRFLACHCWGVFANADADV